MDPGSRGPEPRAVRILRAVSSAGVGDAGYEVRGGDGQREPASLPGGAIALASAPAGKSPARPGCHPQPGQGAGCQRENGRNQGWEGFIFQQGVQDPAWLNVKLGTRQYIGTSHVREKNAVPAAHRFLNGIHRVGEGRETGPGRVFQPQAEHYPQKALTAMLLQIMLASRRREIIMSTAQGALKTGMELPP